MPTFPPTIDGVTAQPGAAPSGPPMGGMLKMLMGSMGGMDDMGGMGDEGDTGLMAMRDAIAALHKAARLQPELADRIEEALAVLEGTGDDDERPPTRGASSALPTSITANAKTPV